MSHLPPPLLGIVKQYVNLKCSIHAELFKRHLVKEIERTFPPLDYNSNDDLIMEAYKIFLHLDWMWSATTVETRMYFNHYKNLDELLDDNIPSDEEEVIQVQLMINDWENGRWRRPI